MSFIAPSDAVELTVSELQNTFGVLFIGYIVAIGAYGFTFFQTYVYYSRYSMDHWAIKLTVASVSLLDTTTACLISHALYEYLIVIFPYTIGLFNAIPTFRAEIGISVIVILIVQLYYSAYIWTLSRNFAVTGAICLCSVAGFILGIEMTAEITKNSAFINLSVPRVKHLVAAGQAFTFIAALLTFCALCFYLHPRQDLSINPVQGRYESVVAYTMTRGLAATVAQFAFFITFVTMPDKAIWMPFHLLASKLFVNSLLTMLNSRQITSEKGSSVEDSSNFTSTRKPQGTSSLSAESSNAVASHLTSVKNGKAQPIDVTISHSTGFTDINSKLGFSEDHSEEGNFGKTPHWNED